MLKRIAKVVLIVVAISLLLSGIAWASTPEITIKVNGVALSSEIPPLIVSSSTMVPMRTICAYCLLLTAYSKPASRLTALVDN